MTGWLTASEAAAALGLTSQAVRDMGRSNRIAYRRSPQGLFLYPASAVEELRQRRARGALGPDHRGAPIEGPRASALSREAFVARPAQPVRETHRAAIARHEVGHAIVAAMLGCSVVAVRVGDFAGETEYLLPRDVTSDGVGAIRATVAAAGVAAAGEDRRSKTETDRAIVAEADVSWAEAVAVAGELLSSRPADLDELSLAAARSGGLTGARFAHLVGCKETREVIPTWGAPTHDLERRPAAEPFDQRRHGPRGVEER